jgi:phosphatidylserine decarboxylase
MNLTKFLPLSYLSWFLGALARLPLPQPLARLTIMIFARAYKIDPSQATKPLNHYRSIGDFFIRDLKPELRPIEGPIVSPVDARVRNAQRTPPDGVLPQVKEKTYTLQALLGDSQLAEEFSKGYFWNFYLSPSDAHHIYAPVSGQIVQTIHIPGKLWPVNDWALESVEELFAVNERVVSIIESEYGKFAVVMVGATNVGRISLAYHALITNRYPWKSKQLHSIAHSEPIAVVCGEKLGTFMMGSSVVVLSDSVPTGIREFREKSSIRIGQSLCD